MHKFIFISVVVASGISLPAQVVLSNGVLIGSGENKVIYALSLPGIDCTGMNDSSAALNAVTSVANTISHRKLTFAGCPLVRVDHQWLVYGQTTGEIDLGPKLFDATNEGVLGPYGNATGTEIFGCNGAAGAVLRVADSEYMDIHGGAIVAEPANPIGTCTSSSFTGSIESTNSTSGGTGFGWTPTHNNFHDMTLASSYNLQHIDGYKGFSILDGPNQEMYRLDNMSIRCGYSPNSSGFYSFDQNADSTKIAHGTGIEYCKYGIDMHAGAVYVEDSNLTGNGYSGYSETAGGATFYEHGGGVWSVTKTVTGDGSGQILGNDGNTCGTRHNWKNNQFNYSGIANTVYAIDLCAGDSDFEQNEFLAAGAHSLNDTVFGSLPTDQNNLNGSGAASLRTVGNTYDATYLTGVQYPNPVPWQHGESHTEFDYPGLYNTWSQTFSNRDDSYDVVSHAQLGQYSSLGTRSPFYDFQSWNTAVPVTSVENFFAYSIPIQTSNDAAFVIEHRGPSTNPEIIVQPKFAGAIQTEASVAPGAPTVDVHGTTGSTTWTYAVSCVTGSGIETPAASTTVTNGNAVLDTNNFNKVIEVNSGSGCIAYRFYRTAAGGTPSATGLIYTLTMSSVPSRSGSSGNAITIYDMGLTATAATAPPVNYADGVIGTPRVNLTPIPFSSAQVCNSTTKGSLQEFTDSTVIDWSAVVAGGGSNEVLGHCNGTNWTVAAI